MSLRYYMRAIPLKPVLLKDSWMQLPLWITGFSERDRASASKFRLPGTCLTDKRTIRDWQTTELLCTESKENENKYRPDSKDRPLPWYCVCLSLSLTLNHNEKVSTPEEQVESTVKWCVLLTDDLTQGPDTSLPYRVVTQLVRETSEEGQRRKWEI